MSKSKYLKDDLMALECELETFIEYEVGMWDLDGDCQGIRGEFTILERKIIQEYLKKRIMWYEAEIEKADEEGA